jgi:feruloyl esterase
MGHCSGGPGTTQFDMMPVLQSWVEEGKAPETVIASRTLPDGSKRTRPLCLYPKVARWKGSGSTDAAANFTCVLPRPAGKTAARH